MLKGADIVFPVRPAIHPWLRPSLRFWPRLLHEAGHKPGGLALGPGYQCGEGGGSVKRGLRHCDENIELALKYVWGVLVNHKYIE